MHIFLCKTAGHRGGGFGCARQIVKSLLTWNFALWSWGLLVPFWLSREVELKRPRTLHATIAGMPHNHICLRKEPTWRTPIDQLTDRVLMLGRLTIVRRAITAVAVTISAVLQTFLIQAFIQPADLLPSGLTGVAVLLDRVTSLGGVHLDISLGMLALNIPVALLCWSGISKRFVIFSMMQVVLSSLFLNVFHFAPFLGDQDHAHHFWRRGLGSGRCHRT